MRRGRKHEAQKGRQVRINQEITARELRVTSATGENMGVMSLNDALALAEKMGMDLIEIAPTAVPPVAKIIEYGKFQYAENKKQREIKTKAHQVEVKSIQIRIATGDHDLELKAKKASSWLKEGHRVKIELFLAGRAKYMNEVFLNERLNRILVLLTENYKIADGPKKGPKGPSMIIERDKKSNENK